MPDPPQRLICNHYENCFRRHGDTPQGVDWPNANDAAIRYQVMLALADGVPSTGLYSLLDFGCGTGALLDYMQKNGITNLEYSGLDLSSEFANAASAKFPQHFIHCIDIFTDHEKLPNYDFIVMNGVFTEKLGISYANMLDYMENMLVILFEKCRIGMAFNVMSKHVDWERDDLFHVPLDTMAEFIRKRLTRHMAFRSDYGLYEYTIYAYKNPNIPSTHHP